MLAFTALYAVIFGRLIYLGVKDDDAVTATRIAAPAISPRRPGYRRSQRAILATDVKTFSVNADPAEIIEVDDARRAHQRHLPGD